MSPIHMLTIDPGGTTGFTEVLIDPEVVTLTSYQEQVGPGAFYNKLRGNGRMGERWNLILCEDFEVRDKSPTGLNMTSAHLIGIVKLYAEWYKVPVTLQKAMHALGKGGHYSDAKLKELGIYLPAREHAMASLKHFMQWFNYYGGFQYHNNQTYIQKGA